MAQTIRTGALVIVPLAAAVQLHANTSTILPTGSPTCEVNIGKGNSACSSAGTDAPPTEATALPGVVLTGVDLNFSGAWGDGPTSGGTWASTWTVTFSAGGDLSGPLTSGEIIPLNYSFSLILPGSGWNLELELGTSGSPGLYGSQGFSGSTSGSGSLTVNTDLADTSPLVETVVLTFTGIAPNNGTNTPGFNLTDPEFDFGPLQAPEPASAGLFATGLGFLGWMFRRRKRVR